MNEKFTRKLYEYATTIPDGKHYKKDYDTFLAKLQSDPAFQEKIFNGITNRPNGYRKDFLTFVESIGATSSDSAKLDQATNIVAPNDPAIQEQLDYFKNGYLSTMRASSGMGDKFDEMLTKFQDPTLQVSQKSWDKLGEKQKAFITLANRINKADNFKDLNTALDFAEEIIPGYRNKLEMSLRKKEFNPENSVVKALLPNQQYRREQGAGTGKQIVGGVWDALGLPTRVITAGISGATPQAQELGFLQRMSRPDPLSSESERFADFTMGGTLPGLGISKGAGAIARKIPALNKVAYGGETFKDLVEAKSLADIAKQTRLGNAGRGAIRGAGRGVADAVVPATVIATNPEEEGRDWKTEAALTMLGGAAGGALLGGAGGGIVSPEAPNLMEAATRDRLAKSMGVPKQTTSDYGVNQLNAINKLLSGKQAEIADEKAMGLDQLAQGLYGRSLAKVYDPTNTPEYAKMRIGDYVKSRAIRSLSQDIANAAPWEKDTYNEVLDWFDAMPTEKTIRDDTMDGGAALTKKALESIGEGEQPDHETIYNTVGKALILARGNERIALNPITYLDDITQRLTNLSVKSEDPVKAQVYAKAADNLSGTKNQILGETSNTLEKNIPYTGPRDRINYQGKPTEGDIFGGDGLTIEDMQSRLGKIAQDVQGSEKSLAELAALQKRVPSATDQSLAKIGESRMNPIKQGNTYGRELQVKNDVLNYIKGNFSEREINQALQDAGITSLDYVSDAVARELSTGSKAGKAFDPTDLFNLIPSFALTKGVAKTGLKALGGTLKGSVKQGVGTEARGLVAPETEEAPSLQMLVKGGSVPVRVEPTKKKYANIDEMWWDWKKSKKK